MNLDHRTRKWIYGVSLALVPILVATGLLTEDLEELVISLLGALLLVDGGVALSNVQPDATPIDDGHGDEA